MLKNFYRRPIRKDETDREYWKYLEDEWRSERERNPVEFIIEISENPREGEILNVVATPWIDTSKEGSKIFPKRSSKDYPVNITLINEIWRESSLLLFSNILGKLRQTHGLDSRQSIGYLLQYYIFHEDMIANLNGVRSMLLTPTERELSRENKEIQQMLSTLYKKPIFKLKNVIKLWDDEEIHAPKNLLDIIKYLPEARIWTYLPIRLVLPKDINEYVLEYKNYSRIGKKPDLTPYSTDPSIMDYYTKGKTLMDIDNVVKIDQHEESYEKVGPKNLITREGGSWKFIFKGGDPIWLKGIGTSYIIYLIKYSGNEIHVSNLVSTRNSAQSLSQDTRSSAVNETMLLDAGLSIIGFDHAGPILDQKALTAYKKRIQDLDVEIGEAESNNDSGKISKLREAKYIIEDQVIKATKFGNRRVMLDDKGEKDRNSVRKAIKRTIKQIENNESDLFDHFNSYLKTGYSCSYNPPEGFYWDISS